MLEMTWLIKHERCGCFVGLATPTRSIKQPRSEADRDRVLKFWIHNRIETAVLAGVTTAAIVRETEEGIQEALDLYGGCIDIDDSWPQPLGYSVQLCLALSVCGFGYQRLGPVDRLELTAAIARHSADAIRELTGETRQAAGLHCDPQLIGA